MEKALYIIIIALIIYALAKIASFILGRRHEWVKYDAKMPGSGHRLIYTDQKNVEHLEGVIYSKPLECTGLDITGKPDYIFETRKNGLLPVEIKSGEIKDNEMPYYGDLMQLAAYFAIVEEYFGEPVLEGFVIYKDYMFKIKNTKKLRRELKSVLSDMRSMLKDGEGEPAANFASCRNCICKGTVCEYCE